MSYSTHNFQSGAILRASELNEMDEQIYTNEQSAAAAAAAASGTAKIAEMGKAGVYGGQIQGEFVHGSLNFNVHPWVNNLSVKNQISTKAGTHLRLFAGDTITLADFGSSYQIYVVADTDTTQSFASGWSSTAVTIQVDGDYGVMIRNTAGNFDSVDDVEVIVETGGSMDTIRMVKDAALDAGIGRDLGLSGNERLELIDGKYVLSESAFELGNIQISTTAAPIYNGSTKRARTRTGLGLKLMAGDTLKMSTGYFFAGWTREDGTYGSAGRWLQEFEAPDDGEYYVVMRISASEPVISDLSAFVAGFSITPGRGSMSSNMARALDILRFGRFYDHMLLNKTTGTNVIIPLQSIASIYMSKRLGFKVIEANTQETADGKWIVTHGTNNCFGAYVEHVDGTTDISNTPINSMTLAEIKQNVRYKSLYAKYRTAPPSLEEYLAVCKRLEMIPLLQVRDNAEIARIGNEVMGQDNYIAYNSQRSINAGYIMNVRDYATKAEIVEECEQMGHPFMYFMANPNAFTDTDLSDIIETLHSKGFTIGFQDTYISADLAEHYLQLGMDFCATTWNINEMETGNVYNKAADIDWSDFETNGTVSGENLELVDGQYVRVWGQQKNFLSGVICYLRFSGTLKMNVAANFRSGNITSDGSGYVRISAGALDAAPNAMFTAVGAATVYEMRAVGSKL